MVAFARTKLIRLIKNSEYLKYIHFIKKSIAKLEVVCSQSRNTVLAHILNTNDLTHLRHFVTNPQRASTILDMEGTLPRCLVNKLHSGMSKMVRLKNEEDESRQFFR